MLLFPGPQEVFPCHDFGTATDAVLLYDVARNLLEERDYGEDC